MSCQFLAARLGSSHPFHGAFAIHELINARAQLRASLCQLLAAGFTRGLSRSSIA
jgi:hypothetical protein